MKHQAARQLVEAYVGGWRDNDLSRIVSTPFARLYHHLST
jgi:hypothetical protein